MADSDRAYDASRYDSDSDEDDTSGPVVESDSNGSRRAHGEETSSSDANNVGKDIGVWDNLQAIFADLDRQGDSELTEGMQEPLSRLRHLLTQHNTLKDREAELKKVNVGLLVETSSLLNKLRSLEDLALVTLKGQDPTDAEMNLADMIRNILTAQDNGFQLISSSS